MPVDVAEEIAGTVLIMSRHRLGAVLLLNPSHDITGGVLLDAVVSRELLVALAVPEHVNRIHCGAVIIRGDRVERAGVSLSWEEVVERATELADGVAIALDEDTGEIQIVDGMGRVEVVDADDVADVLRRHAREADLR
ncbi:MAG: diadenylate cyclase [Labilithrix sp.]|nr:diadenylate cyclase [Labilithrix sp.]MCW5813361.1 diadenylate cyclase [Labilithrix sp.]